MDYKLLHGLNTNCSFQYLVTAVLPKLVFITEPFGNTFNTKIDRRPQQSEEPI
jgi:hypothetical protein